MPSRPVTVGTTPELLLPYNPKRTSVAIFNEDAAAVFIGEDQAGLLARGSPIQPGGAISFTRALGGTPQDILFGISSAGGADIRITEQFGELPELFEPKARATDRTGEGQGA